ncbi:hypothetical protein [Streptacidiphilus sp. P02-A3a]|uniref:hypothetical protein n=1 Tax=Streptacidiphilus sp. P02-A3a TaxID=2704468 RepID=UPI0015F7EE4C|nr:hypothetical protein [Streptacidiphilus sp. P02-A3a]QMU67431.1 hypothetical protein GXP74_03555 [Streptacidiphilus sp. P02-A3a]
MNSTATAAKPARPVVRRIGSAAVVAAIAAAGLGLGAGTAAAKSAISISVRSGMVVVGRTVQVSATGDSDDFGGTPMQLCVDERIGDGGWQQAHCVTGGWTRLGVRAQHRGELQFRAQLFALVGRQHRVLDRTSDAVTVRVR